MTGEKDLDKLLTSMSPELSDSEYVFCTFPDVRYGDLAELKPVASVRESEGLSLIILKSTADERGLAYGSVFRRITLAVHSSLDAVGLTAAISAKLAEQGISANMVAGFYHDHVFVQAEHAERALEMLREWGR